MSPWLYLGVTEMAPRERGVSSAASTLVALECCAGTACRIYKEEIRLFICTLDIYTCLVSKAIIVLQ